MHVKAFKESIIQKHHKIQSTLEYKQLLFLKSSEMNQYLLMAYSKILSNNSWHSNIDDSWQY